MYLFFMLAGDSCTGLNMYWSTFYEMRINISGASILSSQNMMRGI